MNENAAESAERARIDNAADKGEFEGYASYTSVLPAFYATKTLKMLTAYERGYWYGRMTRERELKMVKTLLRECPVCEEPDLYIKQDDGSDKIEARCADCGWTTGFFALADGEDATAKINELVEAAKKSDHA
jgi:hypothetical protein